MKKLAVHFILALFTINAAWGKAAGLSLPEALEQADIIAHIRIEDDLEIIPRTKRTRSDDGTITVSTNSSNPEEYRKIATASILDVFKSDKADAKIKIRHTNGYGCPNVIYQKGNEYIVFLTKEPDSEYYTTMNFYAGQFRVEEEQVTGFYLLPGYTYPDDLKAPYSRVSAFLHNVMQKKKD